MMKQYQDAKAACGDALLLFRMGDFYELFFDDAKIAAEVLGLTLTSRDKTNNPIPMAGFPHHQLDGYLAKIIQSGLRAAVCEQVEDPRQAKGLVKREVTRVVSPGTVTDDALLDPRESNFLASLFPSPDGESDELGVAWVELSTGRFYAAVFRRDRLADELARIGPSECLLPDGQSDCFSSGMMDESIMVTERPAWCFGLASAEKTLSQQFETAGLDGMGIDDSDSLAVQAAGAVIEYLQETQKASLAHIDRLTPYRTGNQLEIDQATRRSLELTRTIREGARKGSLLSVLDRTVTPMGSRLIANWLGTPLTDATHIEDRLDAVQWFHDKTSLASELANQLRGIFDLERLVARVTTGRASPRDVNSVGRTLAQLPRIKEKLSEQDVPLLQRLDADLDLCAEVRDKLRAAIEEECPLSAREGGIIRPGYNEELDRLRELAAGGKQWILRYQADQVASAGIPNLKVGFNRVFGYYIEVSNAQRDKVPEHYIRKQTLKNAERYVTPELKEYEEKVLVADEQATDLEYELFVELRDTVAAAARRLQSTAMVLATVDCLVSLAELARKRNYCRPVFVEESTTHIVDSRHPVLDVLEPQGTFVPNDIVLEDGESIQIITGPNMAGKSTYIRQAALLTIMAQMGSFVPAHKASLGIADRVFARVGASDELSRGQSTFMVEMTETARILNTATHRSLVVLDEIGRGTSTYDGVSLAWAIIEYIHDHIGCRTMFATHYHELADLERSLPSAKNFNVTVKEWEDKIVFLHKIVPGAADKSYGIHVARLAGVPREVNERAKDILAELEAEHLDSHGQPKIARGTKQEGGLQLSLFGFADHPILDEIAQQDLNNLTPLDAQQLLHQWQKQLAHRTRT